MMGLLKVTGHQILPSVGQGLSLMVRPTGLYELLAQCGDVVGFREKDLTCTGTDYDVGNYIDENFQTVLVRNLK